LLTGKHPHQVGMGKMVDAKGKYGGLYQGHLDDNTPTKPKC
jgi:arylsulfatase A-like enzyme